MSIGQNIRNRRLEAGWNQSELGAKVGVSQEMICYFERGYKIPTLPLGAAIANALGCTVNELLEDKSPSVKQTGRKEK